MALIDDIRRMYPHPMRLSDAADHLRTDRYCIGGSICYSIAPGSVVNGFPAMRQLTQALRLANPLLPRRTAHYLAECIMRENDRGLFARAWQYAERAFTYQPTEA